MTVIVEPPHPDEVVHGTANLKKNAKEKGKNEVQDFFDCRLFRIKLYIGLSVNITTIGI